MKCTVCKVNNQSPGADGMCGSCWAKDTTPTMTWPSYGETTMAMLATGKRCQRCHRKLYALNDNERQSDICVDCA